jgi:hypothetical protein
MKTRKAANAPTEDMLPRETRGSKLTARLWGAPLSIFACPWRILKLSLSLVIGSLVVACSTTGSLGQSGVTLLGPGVINDPTNRTLRFDILKYGLQSFCDEMMRRGVTLKLSDERPVVGRFFGRDCHADVIDDEQRRIFSVRFSGLGYAWTNVTGRVGFEVLASVDYLPDFQVADDRSMYVYFRPSKLDITQMKTTLLESTLARGAVLVTGTDTDRVGREILEAQLAQGFTVIRASEKGEMDYALGLVALGKKPYHPFKVVSDQPVLANDTTEVHLGQQDYVGGFDVADDGRALSLFISIDGAPSINVAVVSASAGKQLLDRYVHTPGPAALVEPPRYTQQVVYGALWKQVVPVPPGGYYVLLDNSSAGGNSAPASAAGDDRAVKVDYVVQIVAAP